MLVLTIIFAVLNIVLGFALATYLGYGQAGFQELWNVLDKSRAEIMPSLSPLSHASPSPSAESMEEPPETNREDILAGCTVRGNADESLDDYDVGSLKPISPENWNLDEKYVETSILRLNIAIMKSDQRAVQIDSQLRACQGHSDKDVIETCLRLLREDCSAYLTEQKEATGKFQSGIHEFENLSALYENIETANLEQAAQVETTLNNLDYMDFHTDPEAANQRLLEEIKNLYVARHRLRDNQEAAFLTVARYKNRLDKIEKRLFLDPLTGICNHIGLEITLLNWWRQCQHQTRQMIAMLFDIDRLGEINHKFGPVAGDRILYHLARYLQTSIGKNDLAGRYAGQQFLVMTLDEDSRTALKNAELWRQSIENIVFLHKDKPIRITVSAAVSVVVPNENYLDLLQRLETIIKDVKQTGPNRIFFHKGSETLPVEQHSLDLPEMEIVI